MNWIKKHPELKTIEEVVLKNTGYSSIKELDAVGKTYWIARLDDVVNTIKQYNGKVYIRGDYDCDGICATAILHIALDALGYPTDIHLPHRFTEGYGLSEKMINDIPDGNHLLITVDNGITAIDSIKLAKEKGLTVIVTDHHLRRDDGLIPDADIIIDPNALPGTANFNGYCGAGLAFKIAEKLLEGTIMYDLIYPKIVSLAAIATIADVMELVEDNRRIVKTGLKQIVSGNTTLGLNALLKICGMDEHICAKDVGFKIAPCINAAGRLLDDGATVSYNLLIEDKDEQIAEIKAKELNNLNETRKAHKENGLITLHRYIEKNNLQNDVPLCIYYPGLHEGIIGIYAGSLAEEFKRPCLVFTDSDKEGIFKGSARSYEGYNLKALLDKCADTFVKYGGHAGAAGMSVEKDKFDIMKNRLSAVCDYVPVSSDVSYYDLEITEDNAEEIIPLLEKFAPFGEGNPEIRFKTNFTLSPVGSEYFRVMGNNKQHIKLFGKHINACCFDMTRKYLTDNIETFPDNADLFDAALNEDIDNEKLLILYEEYHKEHRNVTPVLTIELIGLLSENFFAGKTYSQIEVTDLELKKIIPAKTSLASMLAKKANNRYK